MPLKPHRVLVERFSGYADEAAAFLRRRRHRRRPFARVYASGGRAVACPSESPDGKDLFDTAGELIEVAGRR